MFIDLVVALVGLFVLIGGVCFGLVVAFWISLFLFA